MTDVHNQSDVGNQFNASTLNNPVFLYGEKKIAKYLGILPVIPEVFIGRDEKLQEVHDELFDGNNLLLLVNGEGGIGKTTLAAKYYQRYFSDYAHLGWVFAERSLGDAMLTLAEPLKVEFAPTDAADVRREKLLREMAGLQKPCLLVIDNANDLDDLAAHYHELRRCPNFHILLTTRITEFSHARTCRVGHLNEATAIQLFTTHYPGHDSAEDELLKELLRAVGYNTLVIELLAKNLKILNEFRTGYPLKQMLDDLQHQGLFGLSKSAEVLIGYNPGSFKLKEEKPETVIAAMYDLAKLDPGEEQLLCVFSVLPAEPIAFDTLEALQPGNDALEKSLRALVRKGWIEFNAGAKQFKCSPVVQAVTRLQVGDRLCEQCEKLGNTLIEKLDYEPGIGHLVNTDYQQGALYARYAENITGLLDTVWYEKARLCERIGTFHRTIGNFAQTVSYYEKFNCLSKNLYENHPENVSYRRSLAISYSKLGDMSREQGSPKKALGYYQQYNQLMEELNKSHPENMSFRNNLAISYEKLGEAYRVLGNPITAMSYYEEETRLFEELNETHPENVRFRNGLPISYSKLGDMYTDLAQLEEAVSYYEKSNQLFKELYELYPENVRFKHGLAISYEKLGDTFTALGNPEKAQSYYEDEKRLLEELFASYPENVSIKNGLALSYANLGVFNRDQLGDMAQARRWFEKAEAFWAELVNDAPAYAEFQQSLSRVKAALAAL